MRANTLVCCGAAVAIAASASKADQVLSVVKLPGTPEGIIVVDVMTNVAPTDTWTAAGIRGLTFGGATLIHGATPINPGNANQLVTMLSRPYPVPGDPNRFTNGLVAVAGGYSPAVPFTTLTANEVNIAWFASPPMTATSPSVDGAFARIALNIGATGFANAQCFVTTGNVGPPGSTILFRSFPSPQEPGQSLGTSAATFDVPALVGFNWIVYALGSSFTNGTFNTNLSGWTVANTTNGTGAPGTVTSIDIDGPGPFGASNAATFAAGQAVSEPGVPRGLEMTQSLFLVAGTTYTVDFDWSAQRPVGPNVLDAGRFALIVGGAVIVQDSAPSAGPTLPRYGHVTGSFTPTVTGPVNVGIRISRIFTPVSDLRQYVDNVTIVAAPPCYPNCDGSSGTPRLTSNDFQCFINAFAAQSTYANCDQSTGTPSLTSNDFQCFINAYAAGCS